MEKLPQTPAKTSEICADCGKSVDLAGPCWMRLSPRPGRSRAWHLACRDKYLRERREEFSAALQVLSQVVSVVNSVGDTISEAEGIGLLRSMLPGTTTGDES